MTKLKKFYSAMSQAQNMAIAEYGDVENWDWVSDEDSNNANILAWFNKYFAPYLNKVEIIDNKKYDENENASDNGILVKFADGSIMKVKSFSGYYLHIFYYTNYKTFVNNTSQNGKDEFWFGFFNKKSLLNAYETPECTQFHPFICDMDIHYQSHQNTNDIDNLKNHVKHGCYKGNGRFCARLLMKNGWKAPDDYPFKF